MTNEPDILFFGPNRELEATLREFLDQRLPQNKMTQLCHLMTFFGSDKGNGWHNFTQFYDFLFGPTREQIENIFELGIGTHFADVPSNMGSNASPGASLRGWKHYFKNAQVFGADIDRRILFEEERIKTFYCDQRDFESINEMWKQIGNREFDIIIEDGLHTASAIKAFLVNSFKKLKSGGYWITEDICLVDNTLEELKDFLQKFEHPSALVRIPNPENSYDNALLIIRKA